MRETIETLLIDLRVGEFVERDRVFVPEDELRLATRRAWARVQRAFARRPAGAKSIADYVNANYGLSVAAYKDRVRRLARRSLLRAYAVRFAAAKIERVRLQFLSVAGQAEARRLRAQIASGADFAVLARQSSTDRSAQVGGRLPELPVDYEHPALALAKGLSRGQTSVAKPLSGGGYGIVRVLDRRPADPRPFAQQVRELQRELARRPIESSEITLFAFGDARRRAKIPGR